MKIKVFSKNNTVGAVSPSTPISKKKQNDNYEIGKINNPNIPVASDFDDILSSLTDSKSNVDAILEDALYEKPINEETAKDLVEQYSNVQILDDSEPSLDDKVSKYVQMAEEDEEKRKAIEREKIVKESAERIEEELKAIDPDFAELTAEDEEEVQKAQKQKKKNSIPWRNYFAFFVIITALSACVTFSKYISMVNGNSDAVVAKFSFDISSSPELVVNGDDRIFVFDGVLENRNISPDGVASQKFKIYTFTVNNTSEVTVDIKARITALPTVYTNMSLSNSETFENPISNTTDYVTVPNISPNSNAVFYVRVFSLNDNDITYYPHKSPSDSAGLEFIVSQVS